MKDSFSKVLNRLNESNFYGTPKKLKEQNQISGDLKAIASKSCVKSPQNTPRDIPTNKIPFVVKPDIEKTKHPKRRQTSHILKENCDPILIY